MAKQSTQIVPVENLLDNATRAKLLDLRKRSLSLLKKWKEAPKIASPEQYEATAEGAKDFASVKKELTSLLSPVIKKAKADYDAKKKLPNEVEGILSEGEQTLRDLLLIYRLDQERKKEKKVEKALARGDDEKAAAIASSDSAPAVEGLAFRNTWHAEIVDLKAILRAVLDGGLPEEAVLPNMVYFNGRARAEHESFTVAGAKAVKDTSTSLRS
jgi:hypothetical protein